MKYITPIEIADKIISITGINMYENTRQKIYVEHRALMCFILRDKLQMRWTFIANFFMSQGKQMDHAMAIHLVKKYPIYREKNKNLKKIENSFTFENVRIPLDEIDKVNYLEKKYAKIESDYIKLNNKLKNPLVKLVIDIPADKITSAKGRIKRMKASWDTK